MDRFVLAVALVLIGLSLWIFGWSAARRRFDLVFGDLTADTTVVLAWDDAHERAGRGFQRLGALLTCSGPMVFVVGFPIDGWLFGTLMVLSVIGTYVVAIRALGQVLDGQLPRCQTGVPQQVRRSEAWRW